MDNMITKDEILQGIPSAIRPFISITTAPLSRLFEPLVKAFWTATDKISSATFINSRINFIFLTAPFILPLSTGELKYTPRDGVINACLCDMIFIDCEKMIRYPFQIQIACLLEEFVHIIMHVSDESLVSRIVALLYDGIEIVGGQYSVKSDVP